MTVDPRIAQAIVEAVEENGQGKALARLLIAWFDAIASSNENINDRQSANRHLELLYGGTKAQGESSDAEIEEVFGDPSDQEEPF